MKKPLTILNSAGDTIIEVMIVLAVLGMAFAISSATASRGLAQSRNAEEHSRALGLLDAQVELLRATVAKGTTSFPTDFCLASSAEVKAWLAADNPAPECKNSFYSARISPKTVGSLTYFDLRINWDGAGQLGPQQENFVYRINSLSGDISGGTVTNSVPGQIKVVVNRTKIAAGEATARCDGPLDTAIGAAVVRLKQSNGDYDSLEQSTGVNGYRLFNDLHDGTYKATLVGAPAGYERCPFTNGGTSYESSPTVIDNAHGDQPITFTMRSTAISYANIRVIVKKIPPNSDNTSPSCNNTANIDKSGSKVTLNSIQKTTDSTSTAQYNGSSDGLAGNANYSATITPPSNFQVCKGGVASTSATSASVRAVPGSTVDITDITIRPICTTENYTTQESRIIHHSDTVNDYGWVLTSSGVRSPNGYHYYDLNSNPSPSYFDALYSHYRTGWIVSSGETIDATHYKNGWFSYAGDFGWVHIYDDWWDYYTYQVTGSHTNNWDETQYYDQPRTRNVCPS